MTPRFFRPGLFAPLALAAVLLAAMLLPGLIPGTRAPSHEPLAVLASSDATTVERRASEASVGVIVQAAGTTDAVVAAIEQAGGRVERTYTLIAAVQASVPAAAVTELAAHPAVSHISADTAVELSDNGNRGKGKTKSGPAGKGKKKPGGDTLVEDGEGGSSVFPAVVGATDVWDAGIRGRGVGIAIVDTGINKNDVDFAGRVLKRQSFIQGQKDRSGHGTHVAGIAAGNGEKSDGRYMGVAPEANLIAVKVGNSDGIRIGDVIAGLQWIVDNADRYGIRVANLSFTSAEPESYLTSPLNAAVEQVWFHGIVVVVSAGNRGSDPYASDHPAANDPFVITVGAFSDEGTLDPLDDYLKDWSSRGLSHDGFVKPDVIAPGSKLIASVGDKKSELLALYPENRVEEEYFRMGGTSAAAPVVSGIVALMLEANPELTPDQVKARLVASADPFPGSTAPKVNAYDAVFGGDAGSANQGVQPNLWIDPDTLALWDGPASFDSITWDSITWDSITWDSITWDSITWDSITWDSITWDSITWDSITWDSITWD